MSAELVYRLANVFFGLDRAECDIIASVPAVTTGSKGLARGDFIIINIESDARRRGEKEAFLARLSDKLAASPGIARDDVFVRLSMTAGLEDWSLGSGIAASKS